MIQKAAGWVSDPDHGAASLDALHRAQPVMSLPPTRGRREFPSESVFLARDNAAYLLRRSDRVHKSRSDLDPEKDFQRTRLSHPVSAGRQMVIREPDKRLV